MHNVIPQIQWLKDGEKLTNNEKYMIADSFGVCSLEICCCRLKDTGKYACKATNVKGSIETSCHITVGKLWKYMLNKLTEQLLLCNKPVSVLFIRCNGGLSQLKKLISLVHFVCSQTHQDHHRPSDNALKFSCRPTTRLPFKCFTTIQGMFYISCSL